MEIAVMLHEKCVRFYHNVQVFEILSREDITTEEIIASSFTDEEYHRMRERERRLSRQLSRLGRLLDHTEDALGLECKEAKVKRKVRVQEGQVSVLLEQELQWGCLDQGPDFIANRYSDYTRESARLAHIRGLSTAVHVQNLFWNEASLSVSSNDIAPTTTPYLWMRAATDLALIPVESRTKLLPFPASTVTTTDNNRPPCPWEQWAKHAHEAENAAPMRSR
jgi:hypothetical protein